MVIRRGEIWWANLPSPSGAEAGYRRPVLIVQSDEFNRSRIATVIAIVISSNTKLSQAPGNVLLPKKISGLSKDSAANVSQVVTIDKNFLTEMVGVVPNNLFKQIEKGLRLVMSL